jgi:cellobiose-specific phosphotransferase system component IIA
MLRFLFLVALVVAGAALLPNLVATNPLSPQLSRREMTVASSGMRARFERGASMEQGYMLFGGLEAEKSGHFINVFVSGLEERHVSLISQTYPDFYMCGSPGADSAKGWVEDMGLIAESGSVRNTLLEAVRLHDQRIRQGAERTCLRMRAETLYLEQAHALPAEIDVTEPTRQGHQGVDFYLVHQAEVVPCNEFTL